MKTQITVEMLNKWRLNDYAKNQVAKWSIRYADEIEQPEDYLHSAIKIGALECLVGAVTLHGTDLLNYCDSFEIPETKQCRGGHCSCLFDTKSNEVLITGYMGFGSFKDCVTPVKRYGVLC